MKRSQIHKKVYRKNRLFNHVNRNVVYPTIFLNPNLDEEENNNAVEIIEIKSDVSENEQQNTNNNSWCNTSDSSQEKQDDYKVNITARDKRRQNNENANRGNYKDSRYNDQDILNKFCTDFYGFDCYDRGERVSTVKNPHSELFTIINNHITSDTSTSDSNLCDDIEVIQCENTNENNYWNSNNDSYDNRNMTYDIDGNAEKRTIWIYALKNQRLLSEHDYEFINIPSKESTSTTDDEEPTNIRRIATPIPTYIPKINFPSPTLPTVTEVTEPNKQASNSSDISINNADNTTLIHKPVNGWFKNETAKTQNDNHNLDNIQIRYENNCQALSPRERRRLKHAKINEQNKLNAKKEPETFVHCEPKIIICNTERPKQNIDSIEKEIDAIERNDDGQVKSINNENQVSSEDGGFLNESFRNLKKPQIKLGTELNKKDITDPIEKLDGNWIGESLTENDELFEVYDYSVTDTEDNGAQLASQRTDGAIEESAGDRLFISNMALLKPAEWTQYLPLTGSVPSLHLSISVDTDISNEKKSWCKRFIQFVYCCK